MFPEKIFFRKRNVHEIDFPGKLFLVIEERLNFVQIRVGRELFRQTDGIDVVQKFAEQKHVIVRGNIDREPFHQRLQT